MKVRDLEISKPSPYFLLSILFCLGVLLCFGNASWRNYDDFATLKFIYEINSLKDLIKLFSLGWGALPPIWSLFALFSAVFKPIGIDFVRLTCFLLGFLSLSFSSFLTYQICLLIKLENGKLKNFVKPSIFIEIFSVVLNILNPEIIFHSNSYMPYNLSTISIQLIILSMFNFVSKKKVNLNSDYNIYINSKYLYIATLFSLLFSFQSTILISSLAVIFFIYFYINNSDFRLKKIFKPFRIINLYNSTFNIIDNIFIKNLLKISFCYFLFSYLLKLYRLIFIFHTKPGGWANGINDVYSLTNFSSDTLELISRIIFNLQSIIMQAFYPYRIFQIEFSYLIIIVFLISFIPLVRKNILSKYFFLFSLFVLIITIGLSIKGNFIFSPARHTIFLYPIFWIPVIIFLDQIIIKIKNKIYYNLLLTILFFSFLFGTFSSIREISYSKQENNQLISLLKEADFYLSGNYDIWSNLSLQSSKKFNLISQKKCSIENIKKLKTYDVMAYSHVYPITSERHPISNHREKLSKNRYPISNDDLEFLKQGNEDCFINNSYLSIIKKIEKFNNKNLEQNNLIWNGGSSLYAYLIKVTNIK